MAAGYQITRPDADQLLFKSSRSGEHVIDAYLEAAEKGGRTLGALMDVMFDEATGQLKNVVFGFRVNQSTREIEIRSGSTAELAVWAPTGVFMTRYRGVWADATNYTSNDYVVINGATYICTADHLSAGAADMTKFVATTPLISGYMATMLDDADAATARATLGLNLVDNTADTAKNVLSATKLTTARLINGVSFDGSADVTVTAAAGTLTGATLAANVTASSLTSVGTLGSLTVSGAAAVGSLSHGNLVITSGNASVTDRPYIRGAGDHLVIIPGGTAGAVAKQLWLAFPGDLTEGTIATDIQKTIVVSPTGAAGGGRVMINVPDDGVSMMQVGGSIAAKTQILNAGAEGRTALRQVGTSQNVHIRPNSTFAGYLSYTEDGVADRWAVGIEPGNSNLHFRAGALNGTIVATLSSTGLFTASSLRINKAPVAAAWVAPTHTLTLNVDGTDYRFLLATA